MSINKGMFKKIGYGFGGVVVAAAIYFGFLKDDNKKYIETRKEEDPEPEEGEEDAEDFKEA